MRLHASLFTRAKNTLRGALDEKIVYFHLPKCGGTSILHAIRSRYITLDIRKDLGIFMLSCKASSNSVKIASQTNYPYDTSDDYPILKFRENLLLYFMDKEYIKYIGGHFPFSEIGHTKFHEQYTFVTMLRDPVKRWISSYFFNRFKEENHRKIEVDIDAHLDSDFGRSQGHEFVKFLGGCDPNGDYTSIGAIERAKKNLNTFSVVGFLEYPDDFLKQFKNKYGVKLQIDVRNQSPVSSEQKKETLSEKTLSKIRKICEPDIEIYQYAIESFLHRNQY